MKKRGKCFVFVLLIVLWMKPFFSVFAASPSADPAAYDINSEEEYLKELYSSVDFSDIDSFVGEEQGGMSFSDLVFMLMEEDSGINRLSDLAKWIGDALLSEISLNKKLLLEIVLIAFSFSILKNFAGAFGSSYVADMCFVLVYCVLALMLLTSVSAFQEIVAGALEKSVSFMRVLVPTFSVSMVFSSNITSSVGFYQMAFLIIYLVEWIFLTFLLPMVHVYILMELFNHFLEDEKFLNLTELFRDLIQWGIKITSVAVLGLNVVQNLISPAKDRMAQGTIGKVAAVIPGIGGAVNSVGEILLGGGIVVKNCIGTAGLFALSGIVLVPMLKVACMALFYKAAAAVTEPVTDKRIAGCLKGMAEGAMLYMKLLGYCLVLLFLTLALTIAATSFIY